MMNYASFNLLDMLGEMYDSAISYSQYSKECTDEELLVMFKDLVNRIIELNDFVFENVNLEDL